MNLQRGDIVLVDFDPAMRAEAARTRPAVIVTSDSANAFLPTVVVVPLTSNLERIYPHEFVLERDRTGLHDDSKAQVQYIRHISRERIQRVLGYIPADLMIRLDSMMRDHLGL